MSQPAMHNQPEYTVSEISGAIKRTVENAFDYVRVRGEISGAKLHSSGHLYLSLKDVGAVISAVCWKGKVSQLKVKAEEGLEVIATGKITTFAGQSKYQLVIESMEPAGVGALMALLEKHKKEMEAKGLFAPERKKALPYMPTKIGVVTSPTGAVIRDILHRITERFPCRVTVWPVRVQGQGAEHEIAAAIRGFNELPLYMRPEVIIVARGGGSLEDLWCFNEEAVIYAVAESQIPIISAVGHETDTTLIDYVSDRRAPTPTAAAEMVVPVLSELKFKNDDLKIRLSKGVTRLMHQKSTELNGLVRGIPNLQDILGNYIQRLDSWTERLNNGLPNILQKLTQRIEGVSLRLNQVPHNLKEVLAAHQQKINGWSERLNNSLPNIVERLQQRFLNITARMQNTPKLLINEINSRLEKISIWHDRMGKSAAVYIDKREQKLISLAKLFDSYNYKNVLKRGFALVKSTDGKLIKSANDANGEMTIEFADGNRKVRES